MRLECHLLPLSDQVFTHIDGDTNVSTVFAVSRIREHCLRRRAKVYLTPIEPSTAYMIRSQRGLEVERLARAMLRDVYDPLLYLQMHDRDDTCLLADGSHTYCARYLKHHRWALAYMVPRKVWQHFIVADFPTIGMTKSELLSSHSGLGV